VVRAAYAAWNRGDLDAVLESMHPDIEVTQDSRIPGAITAAGKSAARAWLESFDETWEHFELALEEIVEAGEAVAVVALISARGKASGVSVEQRVGHVLTMRDGQTIRWQSYMTPEEALEAVGLPDGDSTASA
jgi:ketosteroid isomerase-like protein